jgi:hypothetical protein
MSRLFRNPGSFSLLELYGPVQAYNGIAFTMKMWEIISDSF